MATFTNQARLTSRTGAVSSNVAVGEVLDALTVTKEAVGASYTQDNDIAYTISIVNSGTANLNGVTVTDDLGAYTLGTQTLYPLTYVAGSATLYQNGILQPAPTVNAGPPLVFSGITIPAGGNVLIVYEAAPTNVAPLAAGSTITNTATLGGTGITPESATEVLPIENAPLLNITKNIDPIPVREDGILTFTFTINNYGNTEADAAENISVTDTFNPVLSDLTAALNGTTLTPTTQYTYSTATGAFATTPGVITVPAATYTQDPTTGVVTTTPGTTTLTVSGRV